MDFYTLSSIILTIAVLIAYINHRYTQMQSTIAIMSASLLLSIIFILLHKTNLANIAYISQDIIQSINFPALLLKGMLSFLLFAGALTIDLDTLKNQKWIIGTLASLSTIASTLIIGLLIYYLLILLNIHLPIVFCFIFGALISPTDPIAVLTTFKTINAPKPLSVAVAGESLFNDGVGIVIFTTLYTLTFEHTAITAGHVLLLFSQQALGGIAYGALLGFVTMKLIKKIDDHRIIILLTLGVVTGGYSLALALDISGPLAMVVSGIMIGNGCSQLLSPSNCKILHIFWEVVDEILNAVLFLLIGFELLTIHATHHELIAMLLAIPLVLLVRLFTISIPIKIFQLKSKQRSPYTITILTWGGLRGGLAVALALSLPNSPYRDFILAMTFAVVVFSVIVQGLSIKPLVQLAKKSHQTP